MKKGKFAYYARLYSSVPGATIMDSAQILPIQSPQGFHEGLATFTHDGQSMIFTRWADKDGKRISALFRARKTDKGWSKPEKMGAPFNVDGANSTQPFITKDQRYIIFSSNRPGGFGKYDIWYAPLHDSVAQSKAINMGTTINTSEDDMSPFYHQQTSKLVFSSNGRVGMGGFDIYSSTGDLSSAQWDQVNNAGIPINSSKDDLYFIATDDNNLWQNGWLSSDRNSDCCLEIFAFNQLSSQLFSGVVIDKVSRHPIPGAIITLKDLTTESNDPTPVAVADSNGRYHFNLVNTKSVQVKAGKTGYDSVTASYTIGETPGSDSTVADTIMLTATRLYDPDVVRTGTDPPEPAKTGAQYDPDREDDPGEEYPPDVKALIGTLNNQLIHFDFDEAIIQEKYFSFLDSVIDIMNMYPSLKIEIGGHTDAFGTPSYNERLGQNRTEACINYLVNGGIPASRLSGASFGATAPIAKETIYGKDNTLGRHMNRRVELRFVEPQSKVSATTKPSTGRQTVQLPPATSAAADKPAQFENGVTAADGKSEFAIIVHYSFDKAVINNSYYRSLDTLAEMMQASPSMKLTVNGHTDTRGSDEYNLQLADERVKSCIRYLVKKGIAKERLTGNAYGECCPVAQETVNGKDDPQARWMNRRVEFSWLKE
jgi:outer membrane protein OmpA-like peptidoglycan-associated protein